MYAETALADRLWSTKVTPFASLPSPSSPSHDDTPDVPAAEGTSSLRPSALLITSEALSSMDTATILAYLSASLTSSPGLPTGLEWVDDNTVVLLFPAESDATEGYRWLTGVEMDEHIEGKMTLRVFKDDNEGGQLLPFEVRAALASDIRKKDAAKKSSYYARERATRPTSTPYDTSSRRRAPRDVNDLDAELDRIQSARENGDEMVIDPPRRDERNQRRGDGRRDGRADRSTIRERGERGARGERGQGGRREKRRGGEVREKAVTKLAQELDDELDAYLRNG